MGSRGRPSDFTQVLATEIVEAISDGITLAEICRRDHMPDRSTVYDWLKLNEPFSQRFARARDEGHDAIAYRLRDTARGKTAEEGGDSTGDVQRDKLIVDTDLKLLAKWDRRYSDKYDVNHSGALTIQVVKFGDDADDSNS